MIHHPSTLSFFFFNDTATTEIYTLSLHDALPIYARNRFSPSSSSTGVSRRSGGGGPQASVPARTPPPRSEEHTSELQSRSDLVCRLLLEKKNENHRVNTGLRSESTVITVLTLLSI